VNGRGYPPGCGVCLALLIGLNGIQKDPHAPHPLAVGLQFS
jgi:hypothetical protein